MGADDCSLGETASSLFEQDEGISFPVYENYEKHDGDGNYEHIESIESSPAMPSMILRPISQGLIERPEDDTAARMQPVIHVDYLSHEWREEDLWSTWKHIVAERTAYSNSMRLENASWRCWEKTRRNLQTVSPGSVKWLKDHDVTWLYGPLQPGSDLDRYRSDDTIRRSRRSSSIRHHQKPILKKRSLSELMLRRSVSSASLLKQAATAAEAHNNRSGTVSLSNSFLFATPVLTPANTTLPSSYASGTNTPSPNSRKNVRFHELVEQCVALANLGDDESRYFSELEDDAVVMRKTQKRIPKHSSTMAYVPSTASKTIEKLPHAPLKSPEETREGLGSSYFSTQHLKDESECAEEDDWKPPTWFHKRKDSVHLLHDKLDAIRRSIGTSSSPNPLRNSSFGVTSLENGDAVTVAALSTEGKAAPITFKLTPFSFTSTNNITPPALSSSSSNDNVCPAGSNRLAVVDPAFSANDYFSPRFSETETSSYDDDEYDWIEGCALGGLVNIKSPYGDLCSPATQPQSIHNMLSSNFSRVSELDPMARTSSDSGYSSEYPDTMRYARSDHASVRDTYNSTAETEKERAVCDWALYPGAWDAVELEEAVAWSRGF